jgi:hypothetical protein
VGREKSEWVHVLARERGWIPNNRVVLLEIGIFHPVDFKGVFDTYG